MQNEKSAWQLRLKEKVYSLLFKNNTVFFLFRCTKRRDKF